MSIFDVFPRRKPSGAETAASAGEAKPVGEEQRERISKQNLARLQSISAEFKVASANADGGFVSAFEAVGKFFLESPQFTATDWIAARNSCDELLTIIRQLMGDTDRLEKLESMGFEIAQLEALRRTVEEIKTRGFQYDSIYSTTEDKVELSNQLVILHEQQKVLTENIPKLISEIKAVRQSAPLLDENLNISEAKRWLSEAGSFFSTNANVVSAVHSAAEESVTLQTAITTTFQATDQLGAYVTPAARQDWAALNAVGNQTTELVQEFDLVENDVVELAHAMNFLVDNEQLLGLFALLAKDLLIPTELGKEKLVAAIQLVKKDILPLLRLYEDKKNDLPQEVRVLVESVLDQTYLKVKEKATKYLVDVLLADNTYQIAYPLFAPSPGSYSEAIDEAMAQTAASTLSTLEEKQDNILSREALAYNSIDAPTDPDVVLPAELLDAVRDGLKLELEARVDPAKQHLTNLIDQRRAVELQDRSIQELKDRLTGRMNNIMRNPVMRFSVQTDGIKDTLDPIDNELVEYKKLEVFRGREVDLAKLELDVLLFKYTYIKRAIHEHLAADENKSANHSFYYSASYDETIDDKGFKRLNSLALQLNTLAGKPEFSAVISNYPAEMREDLKIFSREYNLRRVIFFAERSMESRIFGEATSVEQGASRTFPLQAPEIFPTHEQFIEVVQGSSPIIPTELSFPGERRYSREIDPKRAVQLRDFSKEDGYVANESRITAHGEIMRLLDLLYSDRLYMEYKNALDARGGVMSPIEQRVLMQLKGFFKEMHISTNKYELPALILEVSKLLSPSLSTTELEIKQTWYFHTMLLNHAMLNPGESPRLDDKIYKANQWFTYVTSTEMQGVAVSTIKEQLAFFGLSDPNKVARTPGDPPGKNFFFEREGVPESELSRAKNIAEKIGFFLEGGSNLGGVELREMLLEMLEHDYQERLVAAKTPEEKKKVKNYKWLANLPLVVLRKNPISRFNLKEAGGVKHKPTFRVLPMPLQMMLFKDVPPPGWAGKRKLEVFVKRWGVAGSGLEPAPVTAADYFDEKGQIQYELIPWDKIVSGGELNQYYNNLKNLENFRAQIQEPPSDALISRTELAKGNNDAKYAAAMIPEKGLEVLAGRYHPDVIFWQWTVTRIFARCIYLISSETKNLREINTKLWQVADVVGSDTVEAIQKSLTKLFGSSENAERMREGVAKQLETLFKLQR